MIPGQQVSQPVRDGQHPLADGHVREDVDGTRPSHRGMTSHQSSSESNPGRWNSTQRW
jgi:hypothetical protein